MGTIVIEKSKSGWALHGVDTNNYEFALTYESLEKLERVITDLRKQLTRLQFEDFNAPF